jgi:hypothetical protein
MKRARSRNQNSENDPDQGLIEAALEIARRRAAIHLSASKRLFESTTSKKQIV